MLTSPIISEVCNALTISSTAIGIARTVSRPRWFWNRWFRPNIHVAVFGGSGSGKTRFLSQLLGKPYKNRSTFYYKPIDYIMPDGRKIVFYDSPGQPTSRPERAKVKDKIIKRKISGVINVVCYGYNEVKENKLKVFDKEKGVVRQQYLTENRKIELRQLDEWIGDIDSRLNVKWILTLVNKMDVWHTQREEVMEYYTSGEYNKKFAGVERVCKVQCLPHCSVIEPFGDRPMMLYIGESEKSRCHLQLIETLKNFVSHV